ncbi:MBL fold metallo-hydrolase, partial [Rhodococcus sp. WS4]
MTIDAHSPSAGSESSPAAPPIRATTYVGRWPRVPHNWPEMPTGTFSPTTATIVSG